MNGISGTVLRVLIVAAAAWLLSAVGAEAQTDDLEIAGQLNREVSELYFAGRYREAIPLAERVLAIRVKVLAPDHRAEPLPRARADLHARVPRSR